MDPHSADKFYHVLLGLDGAEVRLPQCLRFCTIERERNIIVVFRFHIWVVATAQSHLNNFLSLRVYEPKQAWRLSGVGGGGALLSLAWQRLTEDHAVRDAVDHC